ncbi:MAG: hypothetical protein HYR68_03470 [Burkholderiales bacterium]|nr:hypothetical protein [Burkholderiales bacterium]
MRTAHPTVGKGFALESAIRVCNKRHWCASPVDSSLRWNDGFERITRIEAASCLKLHE